MKLRILVLTLSLVIASVLRGVVIAGDNGSTNTSAPANDPGWANVGIIGSASGVYLGNYGGNYWVLTASHVGVGSILLEGNTFAPVNGSAVRVQNSDGSNADLLLFRIASDPLLPTLTLSASRPTNTSQILNVGAGLDRVASPLTGNQVAGWTLSGSGASLAWQEQIPPAAVNVVGYYEGNTRTKRWGVNNIEASDVLDYGHGLTTVFISDFDIVTGESQGATGDSGGAAFFKNGANWELAGIMGAIGLYQNQPANTAVLGNVTYYADVANYRSFILGAIPEPSEVALAGGLAAMAVVAWRRRKPVSER
jgi:hypothetical protein